jgi:peptidyl-prolyl cis-trans isomerase B (cyclophilin B)
VRRAPLLIGLLLALGLSACGGDDDDEDGATPPPAMTDGDEELGCRDVEQPEPRRAGTRRRPSEILDTTKTHAVVVKTNCGDFTIELDLEAAPQATASFVALAEADYFDGTFFHRIVPGFVIQGGDPSGTGAGGPGYQTVDRPPAGTRYTKGVVAMAKTAAEPAGTAGSQFFVVTGDDIALPPDYAVLGQVTEGLGVVERIGILGDPSTELPTRPVVIEDMVVQSE